MDISKPTIPDERPAAWYRQAAALTYAANLKTGALAVGYSGSAGGMVGDNRRVINHGQGGRRLERLESLEQGSFAANGPKDRPYCNCGEASAMAIALSYGDNPKDIVMATFHTKGHVMGPCPNCIEWVPTTCAGYFDGNSKFQCQDPGCGGGSGGGRGGGFSGGIAGGGRVRV